MSLDLLKTRVEYYGGDQKGRLVKDKLKTLKKAIKNSYQSATIILNDNRQFKCLINPDKLKPEFDNKIISIPFEAECLNNNRIEKVDLKPGDTFKWKENGSIWIVFLRYLEEYAYFRGEIRRCEKEESISINGKEYFIYIRGPVETKIPWNQKRGDLWNTMNYTLAVYVQKNEDTLNFFHRFQTIEIGKQNWQVQAVNKYDGDGIIEVFLKEYFSNDMENVYLEEQNKKPVEPSPQECQIVGDSIVYPYEKKQYKIQNANFEGQWRLNNLKGKIINYSKDFVEIEIMTGRSGEIELFYENDLNQISKKIQIRSL